LKLAFSGIGLGIDLLLWKREFSFSVAPDSGAAESECEFETLLGL
jgi:hypothetical protein